MTRVSLVPAWLLPIGWRLLRIGGCLLHCFSFFALPVWLAGCLCVLFSLIVFFLYWFIKSLDQHCFFPSTTGHWVTSRWSFFVFLKKVHAPCIRIYLIFLDKLASQVLLFWLIRLACFAWPLSLLLLLYSHVSFFVCTLRVFVHFFRRGLVSMISYFLSR